MLETRLQQRTPFVVFIGFIFVILLAIPGTGLADEGDTPALEPIFPDRMEDLRDRPEPVRETSPEAEHEPADDPSLDAFQEDPTSAVPYLDRILAVVEGRVITLGDYREAYGDRPLEREALRDLIDETLIDVALEFYGILDSRPEIEGFVDEQLDQQRAGNPGEFQQFLQQQGVSEEEYRRRMTSEIEQTQLIQRLYPELNPNGTESGATVRNAGRMMRFSDEERAHEVYQQLSEAPSLDAWNELYEEYANPQPFLGPHGELDWFGWGTYDPEIEFSLYALPLYGVSEPTTWRGDYVILYREGFKLSLQGNQPDQTRRHYFDQYRSRNLQDHLPRMLAEDFTIHVPYSVQVYLDDESV